MIVGGSFTVQLNLFVFYSSANVKQINFFV